MDFVGPLPPSNEYDSIIVMTDRLTDYVLIKPMVATATVTNIASLFYKSWYQRFGLPAAITSDRDKLFISQELFNIPKALTSMPLFQ